ncbi:MAG: DCC1-like thiol-disulfide oxidoreductase family protein [Pseudomonadota bacterium]
MTHVLSHPPRTASDPRAAGTVFYDGQCPVCSREIGWYHRMRGGAEVTWRDVADPATPIPDGLDRKAMLGRFTVQRRDGTLATGAAGFTALWRAIGPTRWLGLLTDREPFRTLGEGLYRLFLRLRLLWR